MPKEAFGGDDDSSGAAPEEKKRKLDLSRFSKGQDMNIRDLFWELMSGYSSGKPLAEDLRLLENERLAIVRAAIGAMTHPSPMHERLTAVAIARNTLMLLLDAGWQDALTEFLEECDHRDATRKAASEGIGKIMGNGAYSARMEEMLRQMLRGREGNGIALRYAAEVGSPALAAALKKELVIFARGDIGDNQMNAIAALALLPNDQDVQRTMAMLLSHWDEGARRQAAEFLVAHRSPEGRQAAERRLESETDPDVRKLLAKIAQG